MSQDRDAHGWRREGKNLVRGVAAGAIVGVPLLYTMEMWWQGMTSDEGHLLVLLGVTLLVNFLFCLFSGFRERYSVADAASQAVTSVGLSLLFSLAILLAIREITFATNWSDVLGRVLTTAFAVSLGVTFANSEIRGGKRDGGQGGGGGGNDEGEDREWLQLKADLRDVAGTLAGATVFAVSMAPTEEILLIATRLPAWQQLVLLAVSFLLAYLILFASGFQERSVYVPSLFQSPLVETVMATALSLLVALGLLYLVGMPGTFAGPSMAVAATVTLGLPATVGGAAGRLIV